MHTPDLGRYERTATGTTTLSHPEGSARITRLPDRYAVEATVLRAGAAPETLRRITDYDPRTVAILLEDVGPEALCDALERMAPDSYMGRLLAAQVTSYLDPASLAGKRLLDFGSGYGASTFILARLLPDTEIV